MQGYYAIRFVCVFYPRVEVYEKYCLFSLILLNYKMIFDTYYDKSSIKVREFLNLIILLQRLIKNVYRHLLQAMLREVQIPIFVLFP